MIFLFPLASKKELTAFFVFLFLLPPTVVDSVWQFSTSFMRMYPTKLDSIRYFSFHSLHGSEGAVSLPARQTLWYPWYQTLWYPCFAMSYHSMPRLSTPIVSVTAIVFTHCFCCQHTRLQQQLFARRKWSGIKRQML